VNGIGFVAVWDKLAGSVSLLVFIAVVLALVVFRRQIDALLGTVTRLKFGDLSAEFDKVARDAFSAAADKVWQRPDDRQEYRTDPDLYFSDADFDQAKHLARMMPIRRWMPVTRLRVRRDIRNMVHDLADQFQKVRAETPGDDRTKRQSAVVARLRMLAFAAYPMVPRLIAADRAGSRIAAIAFLQVKPCYDTRTLDWLGERISPLEQRFVQYHAAGALLVAARNAEAQDMEVISRVVKQAIGVGKNMDKTIISSDALGLLNWSQLSLDGKPYGKTGSDTIPDDDKPQQATPV
jgi:hypothetical protein